MVADSSDSRENGRRHHSLNTSHDGDEVTYRRSIDDIHDVTLPANTRQVNRYALFEGENRTFTDDSRTGSDLTIFIAAWVSADGTTRFADLNEPGTADWDNRTHLLDDDWCLEISDGIYRKTAEQRSGEHGAEWTTRIKVNRSVVDDAAEEGEGLYIIELRERTTDAVDGDGLSLNGVQATRLVPGA